MFEIVDKMQSRTLIAVVFTLGVLLSVTLRLSLNSHASGLNTFFRRMSGEKAALQPIPSSSRFNNDNGESWKPIIERVLHKGLRGADRKVDLCPVIISSRFNDDPPAPEDHSHELFLSLASLFAQDRYPFTQKPLVVWERGGAFDVLTKDDEKGLARRLVESGVIESAGLDDIGPFNMSFREKYPKEDKRRADGMQITFEASILRNEAFRHCLERQCKLCGIVNSGEPVTDKFVDDLRVAVDLEWSALVVHDDLMWDAPQVEGWALEDLVLLLTVSALLGGILFLLLLLISGGDPVAVELLLSERGYVGCFLMALVLSLILGREYFVECPYRELQDEIGHLTGAENLFNGVTVFRTNSVVQDLYNMANEVILFRLGQATLEDMPLASKLVAFSGGGPAREYDLRDMCRNFFRIFHHRVFAINSA